MYIKCCRSGVSVVFVIFVLCCCVRNNASLDLQCSQASYNWCYIEQQIHLANSDKVRIVNADAYKNTERLEVFGSSNISTIPEEFFQTFSNLRYIRLSTGGNGINTINAGDLKHAKRLKVLNLMSNNIKSLPKLIFVDAPQLEQINLKLNSIVDVSDHALDGMTALQKLYLSYNRIKHLKRNAFIGATRLAELMLDNNQISVIDEGALELPALKMLSLNNNRITSISSRALVGLPSLRNVELSANSITQLPESFFDLPSVEYVNLSHNDLTRINLHRFATMKQLRVLRLTDTNIDISRDVDDYSIDSDLDILDLSHNNLDDADILSRLSVFKGLQILILDEKKFTNMKTFDAND